MKKQVYNTEVEREKYRKVIDAFAELYEIENEDILLIHVCRYGFDKLRVIHHYMALKSLTPI